MIPDDFKNFDAIETAFSLFLCKTDWELLRKQKEQLLIIRDSAFKHGSTSYNAVCGLIHFLDNVQDAASLVLGQDVVFGPLPIGE